MHSGCLLGPGSLGTAASSMCRPGADSLFTRLAQDSSVADEMPTPPGLAPLTTPPARSPSSLAHPLASVAGQAADYRCTRPIRETGTARRMK